MAGRLWQDGASETLVCLRDHHGVDIERSLQWCLMLAEAVCRASDAMPGGVAPNEARGDWMLASHCGLGESSVDTAELRRTLGAYLDPFDELEP